MQASSSRGSPETEGQYSDNDIDVQQSRVHDCTALKAAEMTELKNSHHRQNWGRGTCSRAAFRQHPLRSSGFGSGLLGFFWKPVLCGKEHRNYLETQALSPRKAKNSCK